MISSSSVNGDASLVTDVFSDYKSGITAISNDSVWTGKSKSNAIDQMNNFVSEFSGPIATQLSEFSSALDKYDEWKKKKEELEDANNDLNDAKKDTTSGKNYDFAGMRAKIRSIEDEMNTLSKEIKACLSNVRSEKLSVSTELISASSNYALGDFINYYQTDYQNSYGYGGTIATSGCGPTSMAMVLSYLTGETHDPVELADWSLKNGHRIKNKGTSGTFFPAVSNAYGISCAQKNVNSGNIISSLKNGETIILNVGPGHFTTGGHYIVLRGLTSDGKVVVADPASREKSSKTWDVSTLVNEGKAMWSFDSDKTLGMEI